MTKALWIAVSAVGLIGAALFGYLMGKRVLPKLRAAHAGYEPVSLKFRCTAGELFQSVEILAPSERCLLKNYWLLSLGLAMAAWLCMLAVTHNTIPAALLRCGMYGAATLSLLLQAAEKALLLHILHAFPARRQGAAKATGFLTAAKWVSLGLWVACLFGMLLYRAFQL